MPIEKLPPSPSIETLDRLELWPYVRRALGLVNTVIDISGPGKPAWRVDSKYTVTVTEDIDGVLGWKGECMSWEMQGLQHGGHCKHTLAVCLQNESYRARIYEALEQRGE